MGPEDFHRACADLAQAAINENPAFSDLMPQVMGMSQQVSPADLSAALPLIAEALPKAQPSLGGWLAVLSGSWVESGAAAEPVGLPLVERAGEVFAEAVAFARAWKEATGGTPPDMQDDGPSQEIVDVLVPRLADASVNAMLAWFSVPQFALAMTTVLQTSAMVRGAVPDRERRAEVAGRLVEYHPHMGYVQGVLRVLEGERLLVLDRASKRGWTVQIAGIGDNFQLHVLLGGALLGRPGCMPGEPLPPEWVAWFTDQDPDGRPIVSSPWNLVDGHGAWIYNEGVPADIPALNGTRVVVLDPPSYTRHFPAGRRFPMMDATLTVEGVHHPEDLADWWPHIAPDRGQ
ncbi:hypothetical protein DZF91_13385 [Actinomadura logoneensis]|uniref:Uncharacterized protein n=1 Tax=Actinomadura logoneensis TaxID=2293572 RepID=A0A372JMZ6_9ACTN|nr:hypothetical protein [Actinomadura logoneensis]RFU41144.1 hypothetical protein DZF91_13385 [Actinomadura logoneensis]